MPSSHLILCHPLLLLPPIPPSIGVFSNESTPYMRWPKYWNFSFNIISSKEIPGLISFRMDWLDLLAVQGTLKSLLQYHSSKASILRCSAFSTVQLSHPYMTTGKTIALTRQTLVDKVMSLLLNILSRLVITFLPRSKRLLMSWPGSAEKVSQGCEVLSCSNTHKKGTEVAGIHLRAGTAHTPDPNGAAGTSIRTLANRPQEDTEPDFLYYLL